MALRTPALALLVALPLAVAGCMGQTSNTATGTGTGTGGGAGVSASVTGTGTNSIGTNTTTDAPGTDTHTVTILGNEYQGGTMTVERGDTVRWEHRDGTNLHSVKADDGSFDSNDGEPCPGTGCMTDGDTYSHAFGSIGTFPYHCEVHATMHGTITVVDAPA